MQMQHTIQTSILLTGVDPYGGSKVEAVIHPAGENTGIIFRAYSGAVKASLENASHYHSAILLSSGNTRVLNVEHILATLYACGVDNARVELERTPSRSLHFFERMGIATDIEVVPLLEGREKTLCDLLDGVRLQKQQARRSILKLKAPYNSSRLNFEPIESGLVIKATTNYPIPREQTLEFEIHPYTYKRQLASSRPYAKHVPEWMDRRLASFLAKILYINFGFGTGLTEANVITPPKSAEEWYGEQMFQRGDEATRHTIVDRLGALALLPGRLEGVKVTAKFSGHANDLLVLKELLKNGSFSIQES